MDISELVFSQKNGVFFVWKMRNEQPITTLLRNRENIKLEVQIENAITDGRSRQWMLVGIGHWCLRPLQTDLGGIPFSINHVGASLLRLKNLPARELKSTELGTREMREIWIPHICEYLRKILWEDTV